MNKYLNLKTLEIIMAESKPAGCVEIVGGLELPEGKYFKPIIENGLVVGCYGVKDKPFNRGEYNDDTALSLEMLVDLDFRIMMLEEFGGEFDAL